MEARMVALFFNHAPPHTTGHYVLRALREFCVVDLYSPSEAREQAKTGYDLHLCVDDSTHHLYVSEARPSALWIIDGHMTYRADRIMARRYDLVFVAGRDEAARLKRDGIFSAEWLPLACDPLIHGKVDKPKIYDVAFVGSEAWGRRRRLLEKVKQAFPKSFIGRAPHTELGRIYSQAKIVVNCGIRNDLNMRVFEALCAGSCLVTNADAAGLMELFVAGRHLVTYDTEDAALDQIHHYLVEEDQRERIAEAGRTEVLARHTYRHRVMAIVQRALSSKCEVPSQPRRRKLGHWKDAMCLGVLDQFYKVRFRLHQVLDV